MEDSGVDADDINLEVAMNDQVADPPHSDEYGEEGEEESGEYDEEDEP
jgi:hypothetical protein